MTVLRSAPNRIGRSRSAVDRLLRHRRIYRWRSAIGRWHKSVDSTWHIYCKWTNRIHCCSVNLVLTDKLSSFPSELEADDIEDFCSLALYYESRTPQSFRQVRWLVLYCPWNMTLYYFCWLQNESHISMENVMIVFVSGCSFSGLLCKLNWRLSELIIS